MVQGVFSIMDLIMGPIWLLILYFLIVQISKRYKDPFLRKHFKWGFLAKLLGCLVFIGVYAFYYGGGDTFNYYRNAKGLFDLLYEHPFYLSKILTASNIGNWQQLEMGLNNSSGFISNTPTYTVIRFVILFGLFTGGSYLGISLCFVFASYIGIWGLYRVAANSFPMHYKQLTIPVLYIPSIILWGSGIMKDTVVIGLVGLLTYAVYKMVFKHRKILIQLFIIAFCLYILTNVKQYVIFTYVPMLLLWVFLSPINRMSRAKRILLFPFLLLIFAAAIAALAPAMESFSEQYSLDNVLSTAESTANYIYRVSADEGSAYSLGEISYTPLGIIKVFPQAVIVTLFRPFLFEVRNPVMLMSALESTLFLLATIWIILKVGPFRYLGYISKNSFLLMCFLFSIFFSFAVGISTFNFGSLARYKIPALIFYGFAILIPYNLYRDDKKRTISETKKKHITPSE